MPTAEEIKTALRGELSERKVAEDAERLSGPGTFKLFMKEAWPQIKREEPFRDNWHIDAYAYHLEAVTSGEIKRLQIWVPPQSMKSMAVSVLWPAWEWTFMPWLRYWGASYETRLAGRLSAMSRDLMMTAWFTERWASKFRFTRDAEHYFGNDVGGTRLATSPESTGSGEHGHRILIDDPINAKEADAITKASLDYVNDTWYDGTVSTRGIGPDHARILVMQRLHQEDLAQHLLDLERWTVLCMPERYETTHPYAWRGQQARGNDQKSGSDIGPGDPRAEDDLLWPTYRTPAMSDALAEGLRSHRAIAQLQQRPAAKEGQILKRHWWRFYEPTLFTDPALANRRPRFNCVVQSIDCPLKDKEANDCFAMQAWGVIGANRYLLDLRMDHMNYSEAKRSAIEQARFARKLYPRCPHYILIETGGYGADLYEDLRRILTGVTKIPTGQEGNKVVRADAASDSLEFGNCFLPGYRLNDDEFSLPDESRNAKKINDFIDNCALFPNAKYDDDVDAWSQCMNWLRTRVIKGGRTSSPFKRRRRAA